MWRCYESQDGVEQCALTSLLCSEGGLQCKGRLPKLLLFSNYGTSQHPWRFPQYRMHSSKIYE